MTALIQEDVLEDAAPQRREALGDGRETVPAVPMAEPVHGEIPHDGDQPRREPGAVVGLLGVDAKPPQAILAQRLAGAREDVHHIIVVLGVVPDGCEDETPVPIQEQVPRGVEPAPL